ncbi:MAG: ribonuclease P protein component [Bacteroidia bacterium]|nr:ribonuclease P protein component [Bacteroidia bacterium]NNC85337.1 ribonuclease P protein component [Bacteroidia bacterium]NNM15293.1 ribonuclease P protein component [Bacteroidia bacterium]
MFTFNKQERLKKRKEIDALFTSGNKIKEHPVTFFWNEREADDDVPLKIGFSVSQKTVKSAVKRNRIKRQMREVYRLYKKEVFVGLENDPKKYAAMLIYTSTEMPSYEILKEKIILILDRYIENVKGHTS